MENPNKWTYYWTEDGAFFSHDFMTGKWARNGITEPVCKFRGHYERRISDPEFLKMQKDFFFLVTKPSMQKSLKQSSNSGSKSAPKATSKIKSFVKRKR